MDGLPPYKPIITFTEATQEEEEEVNSWFISNPLCDDFALFGINDFGCLDDDRNMIIPQDETIKQDLSPVSSANVTQEPHHVTDLDRSEIEKGKRKMSSEVKTENPKTKMQKPNMVLASSQITEPNGGAQGSTSSADQNYTHKDFMMSTIPPTGLPGSTVYQCVQRQSSPQILPISPASQRPGSSSEEPFRQNQASMMYSQQHLSSQISTIPPCELYQNLQNHVEAWTMNPMMYQQQHLSGQMSTIPPGPPHGLPESTASFLNKSKIPVLSASTAYQYMMRQRRPLIVPMSPVSSSESSGSSSEEPGSSSQRPRSSSQQPGSSSQP